MFALTILTFVALTLALARSQAWEQDEEEYRVAQAAVRAHRKAQR